MGPPTPDLDDPLKGPIGQLRDALVVRREAAQPDTFEAARMGFACVFFDAMCAVLRISEHEPWWALSCAYQDIAMAHGRRNQRMNRILNDRERVTSKAAPVPREGNESISHDPADGPIHFLVPTDHCEGGTNRAKGWGRVTCPDCLRSRPLPSPWPPPG